MQNKLLCYFMYCFFITFVSSSVNAKEQQQNDDEPQDMSDPLAVYTQAGAGYTDKGLNIKIGQSYDPGKPKTMAMNVIEIKGILGDSIGTTNNRTDSIDIFRFRNFKVNTTNGQATQIDVEFNLNSKAGSASYAFIQTLPKIWKITLYPLLGVGAAVANNVNNHPLWNDSDSPSGLSVPGVFGLIGMYSKLEITDKIWLNYNPIWLSSIGGSDNYKNNTYGIGENNVFTHEVALSYQVNPRISVRYFGNWSDIINFSDGDQRIEFNYQL